MELALQHANELQQAAVHLLIEFLVLTHSTLKEALADVRVTIKVWCPLHSLERRNATNADNKPRGRGNLKAVKMATDGLIHRAGP